MQALFVYIVRCFVMILSTWLICNFIGKKSLAQFTPYDIAILFIISNVISQPLVNKDLFKTALGVVILAIGIIIISKLSLNNKFYGIDGMPSVIIAEGKLKKDELKRNHLNIYTLLSMLRIQGYNKLSDVNYAILEPGGQISVIPKSNARPPTIEEMKLNVPDEGLTFAVIVDGKINNNILPYTKISEDWLKKELRKSYKVKPEEVFYAEIDSNKKLYVNLYSEV
ncbi:DUF421 domain-containing protein [Clostridium rectalis]|uniref:DUF421 domain-containing protein n=1 Tax=Clostridium rectalis TaxID=2040295 RepID=UPI000F63AF62|nr:YetF domain-containing protein [Clostridium rectalis]